MKILLDTNILGRIAQPDHQMHEVTVSAVESLLREGHDLRTVPQVIYEFWAIATRSAADNGFGFSVTQAHAEIERLQQIFPPLRDERGILERWQRLVQTHAVQGKKTHDTRMVAAMERHNVARLLTFNVRDFRRYAGITVIEPSTIMP